VGIPGNPYKYGRLPDVSRNIPRPDSTMARCNLPPADAAFLLEALPRLPCAEAFNGPITMELNGQVVIRAKGADQPRPTDVVLASSSFSGQALHINTNRTYLARALRLGFRQLGITSAKTAIACFDELWQYVWMPLAPEAANAPGRRRNPHRIPCGQS
jgi:hypothetical protein